MAKHRFLLGLGVLAFLAPTDVRAERFPSRGDRTFLWKVSSPSTTVYLLGSVHMAKKDLYPLAKPIEDAFARSKVLVVEADEGKMDPVEMQKLVLEKGFYPAGESLSTKLAPEKLKTVEALLGKLGLRLEQVNQMRPWYLAVTASVLALQKLAYDPQLGIDRHFIQAAKDQGKELKELESIQFQIDLLSGLSQDLQELFVAATLDEVDDVEKRMEKVMSAWKKGDDKELYRLLITEGMAKRPELAPLQKRLLDDRNEGMVKKVEEYLRTKDVHFVVAGAAHMIGEKGICELLRKKGYTVEQVEQ
ncbi:MAG TPA: TraB/GumN family protein [Planctomycetota bacterium]|nr:TraB/GumN family protein [Planctomycetota bacterium]